MTRLLGTISLCILFLVQAEAREFSDAQYYHLPRLFHLDNYDRCLYRKDGLYCVGKFEIYPKGNQESNSTYELIKEYSHVTMNTYNRSFLHRGYCLTTRCPSSETNISARFENCVDQWTRSNNVATRLHTLHYCHSNHGTNQPMDPPKRYFLYAVFAIVLMNIIGTVHDFMVQWNYGTKNTLLMTWSIRENWKRFASVSESTDPRLQSLLGLEGLRSFLMLLIVAIHTQLVGGKTYQFEPRDHEQLVNGIIGKWFEALMTFSQTLISMSSFLATFNILIMSEKIHLNFKTCVLLILKAFIRIWPTYLFVIAFTATWWVNIADGPLWSYLVESESAICRQKFWAQIFFLQNIFQLDKVCIVNTWMLAVNIQLHVLLVIGIWALIKYRLFNLRVLSLLYVSSVILTFIIAYINEMLPLYKFSTPENVMKMLNNVPSFMYFYSQPINCLTCSVAGVILGYVHYNMQSKKNDVKNYQWLMSEKPIWLPMAFLWASAVLYYKRFDGRLFSALIICVDRVVSSMIIYFWLSSTINGNNKMTKIFRWSGWRFISRLSYGISLVHWQSNMFLVASSRTMFEMWISQLVQYGTANFFISAVLALPLILLVEYPFNRFLSAILSKLF